MTHKYNSQYITTFKKMANCNVNGYVRYVYIINNN